MQKKMSIKVKMNGQKSRCKALEIAAGLPGVESATLKGNEKNQIELTGYGVDAAHLTMLLRKKMGFAEIVHVKSEGGEKKEEKKEEPNMQPAVWSYTTTPTYCVYDAPPASQYLDPCTIT